MFFWVPYAINSKKLSLSSFIIYFGTGPIEWGFKRQILPTDSTAIAEIVAVNKPIRVIQWIRQFLKDTSIDHVITMQSSFLHLNNAAAIHFLSNPINTEKTRHIVTKYKYGIKLAEVE